MSIDSARERLGTLSYTNKDLCLPLAVDTVMRNAVLPTEYYDATIEELESQGSGSINSLLSRIIKGFFRSEVSPDTQNAAVAHFNAYGASPQPYFPDVPYDYSEEICEKKLELTSKQLRLCDLLRQAHEKGCLTLFYSSPVHVMGLEQVDPGGTYQNYDGEVVTILPNYIVRDYTSPEGIYTQSDLWAPRNLDDPIDEFAPLPEVSLTYGDEQSSWELIILPPEPQV